MVRCPEFRLEIHEELGSTNAALLERESVHGAALLARRQSAGQGRRGRVWQTLEGNLALSLGFSFSEADLQSLPRLYLLAGVSLFDAVTELLGDSSALTLKWPNDLYLDGRKLAGLLVQMRSHGTSAKAALGIGMNLLEAPADGIALLEKRRGLAGQLTPENVASLLLKKFSKNFPLLENPPALCAAWSDRCRHLGKSVWVGDPEGEKREVLAIGITESGELIVRERSGEEKLLSSEEVSLKLSKPPC